jgi:hypothetical protein
MKICPTDNELIDIAAALRHETQAAYLLANGAWVPESQVEDKGDETSHTALWLAKDKGFV